MSLQSGGPRKANHVFAMLVVSAAIAVGFISAGAFTVYRNMRHTEREREWVDHSQTVLTNLQDEMRRLDRVDFNLQLYAVSKERTKLRQVGNPLALIHADLVQLEFLISDNPSQTRRAQDLQRDLGALETAVGNGAEEPDKLVMACRNDIAILQQAETTLLHERTDISKQSSYKSFVVSSIYLGFSLFIVVLLFVFLFRDAMRRRVDEENLLAAQRELEATVRKLTLRAEEAALLTSARDELQLCTTAAQAYESACRNLHLLVPGTSGAMLIINNSRRLVEMVASWGDEDQLLEGFNPDACCGLRAGKARWRRPGQSELDCVHFAGQAPENYLCVPLAAHGETMGFVFVDCATAECAALAEERTGLILELVELASLAIASLNLRTKLERQSIRDGLTGLFNRRYMESALERELHRSARKKKPLAVMMLDVDHFKQLNDTYGHEAGDAVLRDVAESFQRLLRTEDVICRYGGEEFVVIMPDAPEETAVQRAEMIREAVEQLRIPFRGEVIGPLTISVGISMSERGGDDATDLIRLADAALYRAKHAGRNRVVLDVAEELLALA
jgi:diguanylate cyclase (GGDEF)-like protein